jgi:hypothetical protein
VKYVRFDFCTVPTDICTGRAYLEGTLDWRQMLLLITRYTAFSVIISVLPKLISQDIPKTSGNIEPVLKALLLHPIEAVRNIPGVQALRGKPREARSVCFLLRNVPLCFEESLGLFRILHC